MVRFERPARYNSNLFDQERTSKKIFDKLNTINREYVLQINGIVIERISKNNQINTGEIEILAQKINILNSSLTPPFTVENKTDGGEELRMKYRFLDIRREEISKNIQLRSKINFEIRKFFNKNGFLDIETPYLIKSTLKVLEILLFHLELTKVNFTHCLNHHKHLNNYWLLEGLINIFK